MARRYDELVAGRVTELDLLLELPVPEVASLGGEALGEAVRRMREGRVRVQAGYDGEYGRITLFEPGEARELGGQALLFGKSSPPSGRDCRREAGPRSGRRRHAVRATGSRERVGADLKAFRRARPDSAGPRGSCQPPAASGLARLSAPALNPEQRRAAEHGAGPALVLAGPGTGKTAVLAARIAHLVRSRDAAPEAIAAVTFTNRAAREMRERLGLLLPDPRVRERIRIGTFHSFGLALLKSLRGALEPELALHDRGPGGTRRAPGRAARLPERQGRGPGGSHLPDQAGREKRIRPPDQEELFTQYEATLALHNAVDLDDLLRLPVRLLSSQPEVLAEVRSRTTHLLIDEYQDVNAVQYRLVRLLMPAGDAPLFAIGDPNQAIYGFRGADSRFLGRFREDYPLRLGVRAEGQLPLLLHDPEGLRRRAAAGRGRRWGPGAGPRSAARDRKRACDQRARQRGQRSGVRGPDHRGPDGGHARLLPGQRGQRGEQQSGIRSFADIAVLCRVARQMEPLARALRRSRHPLPGGHRRSPGCGRSRPAPSCASCRPCGRRATPWPASGCSRARLATAEDLLRWRRDFERDGDLSGLLSSLAAAFPEPPTPAGPAGLAGLAAESGGGIDKFLEAALLGTEPDALVREAERVSLLTLHAAKGLEFPCVFITGCEDGLLPYTLPARRPADPEEERRLFYVGLTRAGAYLYLSHARRRFLFGRELRLPPSPFLAGLDEELAERLQPDPPAPPREPTAEQLDLF